MTEGTTPVGEDCTFHFESDRSPMDPATAIPAFLKLSVDAYRSIAQGRSVPPAATIDRSADAAMASGPAEDDRAGERLADPLAIGSDSLAALGAKGDGIQVFERLAQAYREPHRHAHTLQRVSESLAQLRRWRDVADHPHEIVLATWFRDAVFDPMRHDNTGRSARLAFDTLSALGVELDLARRIRDLVVATRQDMPPITQDARLMIDLDMAVLASSPDRYQQYEAQLRAEYAHVTGFIYQRRRLEALKALLARARIYQTDAARAALEGQARVNLAAQVAHLQRRAEAPDLARQ